MVTAIAATSDGVYYAAQGGGTSTIGWVPTLGAATTIDAQLSDVSELIVVGDYLVAAALNGFKVYDTAASSSHWVDGVGLGAVAADPQWVYFLTATETPDGGVSQGLVDASLNLDASSDASASADAFAPDAGAKGGTLSRIPIAGGTPQVLLTTNGLPRALAIHENTLFSAWSNPGRLIAISTATLDGALVASGNFDAVRIAANSEFVYVADAASQQLLRLPMTGGSLEPVVVLSSKPHDVWADASGVWYVTGEPGQLWTLNGTVPELIAGLLRPETLIAVDASFVYWAAPGYGVAFTDKSP